MLFPAPWDKKNQPIGKPQKKSFLNGRALMDIGTLLFLRLKKGSFFLTGLLFIPPPPVTGTAIKNIFFCGLTNV